MATRNKLLINTTKTKMTIFHTPHREVTYPRIKINNSSVEIVDEFYFTVFSCPNKIISSSLSFSLSFDSLVVTGHFHCR